MKEDQPMHLLDGKTLEYTYENGWSFRLRFYDGKIAYEFLGASEGEVSNRNENIPYQSREIREDLYHVVWHEANIHDVVSLVIDLAGKRLYSAALLGYGKPDANLLFESALIHNVVG